MPFAFFMLEERGEGYADSSLRNSGISHKLHHGSTHIRCGPMRERLARDETGESHVLFRRKEPRAGPRLCPKSLSRYPVRMKKPMVCTERATSKLVL